MTLVTLASRTVTLLTVAATGLLARPAPADDAAATYGPGANVVESQLLEWHDATRDRDVPVKIYRPRTLDRPAPVIIFSHGLGGSREGYAYLGQQWASQGFISVHLQHLGSDNSLLQAGGDIVTTLKQSLLNPQNTINRPKDVSFAIDELERLNRADGPLQGRLDLDRIGAAGHSFGALTVMAVAGQAFVLPSGRTRSVADPRIKAAVAMSTPVRRATAGEAYKDIRIPVLHMTGTLDDSPVSDSPAAERRIPFDNSPGPHEFLVIFSGGDHLVFSGRFRQTPEGLGMKGMTGDPRRDDEFHRIICEATTAFWDAFLRADQAAKSWLTEGGLKERIGDQGSLETK